MANITKLLERVKDAALDLIGYRVKSSGKEEKEIKKSLRNVSGYESDKKLQGNTDDLHTIRLKAQLRELGVPTHKQESIIQELLKNGKTSDLVHIQMHILDQQTHAQVRLSLTGREDDKSYLKIHFIRHDLKDSLAKPFMGHSFTKEQKKNLLTLRNVGEAIRITKPTGLQEEILVFVDSLTNELVATPVQDISISDKYKEMKLSDEIKDKLKKGHSVVIEGIRVGWATYDVTVQYNAETQKLDPLSTAVTKIGDTTLSKQDVEALRQGKAIRIPNLIDKKGEKYSAYVKQSTFEGEIQITPAQEYRVQVRHNNVGKKTEKNKRIEKKQGNSVVKSGKAYVKKQKRNSL